MNDKQFRRAECAGFSERLKFAMATRGLTQEEISNGIRVNQAAVSRWLSGDRVPYDRTAKKLGDFLGIDWRFLLKGIEDTRLTPGSSSDIKDDGATIRSFRWKISQIVNLEWHFRPEMPDDDVRVLFAAGDDVEVGHHENGVWINTEEASYSDGDVYAWAHLPAAPEMPVLKGGAA